MMVVQGQTARSVIVAERRSVPELSPAGALRWPCGLLVSRDFRSRVVKRKQVDRECR